MVVLVVFNFVLVCFVVCEFRYCFVVDGFFGDVVWVCCVNFY